MFDPDQLNYSAFSSHGISCKSFTRKQMVASGLMSAADRKMIKQKSPQLFNNPWVGMLLAMLITLWCITFLSFGLLSAGAEGTGAKYTDNLNENIGLCVVCVVCSIPTLIYIIRRYRAAKKLGFKLLKFAADNGLSFNAGSALRWSDSIVLSHGSDRYARNEIVFADNIKMADYQYTVGNGRAEHTKRLRFASLELPRAVPQLVLDSKHSSISMHAFEYQVQKIELEGDFAEHFTLYAPPKYQADALQIFTPDVMSALLDFGRNYDFELVGNHLYIYAPYKTEVGRKQAQKIRHFLTALTRVGAEISKQTQTYSDDRAGNIASGRVAAQGRRLQRKYHPVLGGIVLICLAIFFALCLLGGLADSPGQAAFVIALIVILTLIGLAPIVSKIVRLLKGSAGKKKK